MTMDRIRAAYDELYAYTMQHDRDRFILQHVVDAQAAQTATIETKPLGITFALVGLSLHVEKGFSGRQVQRAHMLLAGRKRNWPNIRLPEDRGSLTAADVLAVPEGPERDLAVDAWCASVWSAFRDSHATIVELLREYPQIAE